MGARHVDAPDGRHWTLRRQRAPRLVGRGLRARIDRARRGDRDRSGWLDLLELPGWAEAGSPALIADGVVVVVMVVLLLLGLPLIPGLLTWGGMKPLSCKERSTTSGVVSAIIDGGRF